VAGFNPVGSTPVAAIGGRFPGGDLAFGGIAFSAEASSAGGLMSFGGIAISGTAADPTVSDAWYTGDQFIAPRVTFSNSNLTATSVSGTSPPYADGVVPLPALVTAAQGRSSGKWYWEITLSGTWESFDFSGVGIAPCVSPGPGNGMGFSGSPSGAILVINGGAGSGPVLRVDGTDYYPVLALASGDTVAFALDCDNQVFWLRVNNGGWCGSSGVDGLANPATNTEGISLAGSLSAGRVFPAAQFSFVGPAVTANFGGSSFDGSVPAGFYPGWPYSDVNTFGSLYVDNVDHHGALPAVPITEVNANAGVSPYYAPAAGSITSVVGNPLEAESPLSTQILIYDDSGTEPIANGPGLLLGASNVLTSLTLGENLYTFDPPVAVTNGQLLWIGVLVGGDSTSVLYYTYNNVLQADAPFDYTNVLAEMSGPGSPQTTFAPVANDNTAVRVQYLINYAPAVLPSGLGEMTFGGLAFSGEARRAEQVSGLMSFGGIAINASSATHLSLTGDMAFEGVGFSGTINPGESAVGRMTFNGLAMFGALFDYPPAGSGRRSSWTYGA